MKKYLTNSWLANILVGCHTITLFGFIHTQEGELRQNIKNHESIHVAQWMEIMTPAYFIATICVILGVSAWWLLLPPSVYYVWYLTEWLIRLIYWGWHGVVNTPYKSVGKAAYKTISFEAEAYSNEDDSNYNENRTYFAFIKYLK